MLDNLLAWLADWRHPAVIVAAVVLLYLARDGAQRLLRTAFLFAAHGLRLVDRWIRAGAEAAMSRHDRLVAGLREDELQPRIPDDARLALRTLEKRGADSPEGRQQAEPLRLGHSSGIRFVFALVLMLAVGIAGWLNFALLERPMAEVVGDSYRVMRMPIYRLAALAIIVLEVAVGMVLLEALGGTTMFPQFERLEQKKKLRIAVVVTMATALVVLALAFLGFAIEALIRNGRVVAQLAIGAMLQVASFLVRLLRQLVLGLLSVLLALYDFAIFLPLFIERKWREARS